MFLGCSLQLNPSVIDEGDVESRKKNELDDWNLSFINPYEDQQVSGFHYQKKFLRNLN